MVRAEPRYAAQYLRMSTEHQQYSPENQASAIAAYAAERGLEIVRTYQDLGVSGLGLKGRAGLKALIADVVAGAPGFDIVLIYDVSRWGRFQDPDQSAHYEFICREAGVGVEYCAEQFANDGSPSSTILKHLRRLMAAEFSRDLSRKVRAGKLTLAARGYWMGGDPGYGLRRALVGADGRLKLLMEAGERKALHTDRTVVVHGPEREVAAVRRIFRLLIDDNLSRPEIARQMNLDGPAPASGAWNPYHVGTILRRGLYAGQISYPQSTRYLGEVARRVPVDERVVVNVVEPIVSEADLALAAEMLRRRARRGPREQMLREARALLDETGRISARALDASERTLGSQAYVAEFGSLTSLYEQLGYTQRYRHRSRRFDPWRPWIERWLAADAARPDFNGHCVSALWRGLRAAGLNVHYGQVWTFYQLWYGEGIFRGGRHLRGLRSRAVPEGPWPARRGIRGRPRIGRPPEDQLAAVAASFAPSLGRIDLIDANPSQF